MKTHTKMTLALLAIMTGTSAQGGLFDGKVVSSEEREAMEDGETLAETIRVSMKPNYDTYNANIASQKTVEGEIVTLKETKNAIVIPATYEREGVAQAEVEGLNAAIKDLKSKTDTQKAIGVELESRKGKLKNQLAEMETGKNGKNGKNSG